MKIVKEVPPPCGCHAKLEQFRQERGGVWGLGTTVQCDCGKYFELESAMRGEHYWKPILNPALTRDDR